MSAEEGAAFLGTADMPTAAAAMAANRKWRTQEWARKRKEAKEGGHRVGQRSGRGATARHYEAPSSQKFTKASGVTSR